MRVCHISPHLPPDQAANALLPAELGTWARARGDEVSFVAHEPAQGRAATEGSRDVHWVPRRTRGTGLTRLLKLDTLRDARAINAMLDRSARNADLLHLHSNGLIIELASAWAERHERPSVLTLYGTEIWHYRRRWPIDPFTRAYRRASEVTFYSKGLLDRARALRLDRDGLSVVYPPVSESFAPQDPAAREILRGSLGIAEPLVVLNVKRLHELAGQRFLIDAFARATRGRHDVRLVICGTGPLRQELEAQAGAAGIANKITFAGLVSNDDVARYAAVADVFALPSLLEALPTVAVEALASGTPVVSADHPGGVELHELFGDDVLVVPKSDAVSLATALTDALAGPRRVRPDTLRIVSERFRRRPIEAAYTAIYERALARTS